MIIKKILTVLVLFVFVQGMSANEQSDLREHFLKKIDKVVLVVKDKAISKDQRNSDIIDVLTPMFDFELMAKLSLGKAYKKLQKEDRKKFVHLYVERMKQSYSSKLDAYSNEEVEIKKIDQPKKNRIALVTDLVGDDEKLEIVYKFYKPRKQKEVKDLWLIYDVEILGVSILKADKAQFKEFLQTKDIYSLMEVLVKK